MLQINFFLGNLPTSLPFMYNTQKYATKIVVWWRSAHYAAQIQLKRIQIQRETQLRVTHAVKERQTKRFKDICPAAKTHI